VPATPRSTFIDDLLNGRATAEDLDDRIDEWHDLPSDNPNAAISLHEFLGMNWEEFSKVARDPSTLDTVIAARKASKN